MKFSIPSNFLLAFSIFSLLSSNILANENSYNQARILQQEGKYDEAIEGYKRYLTYPIDGKLTTREVALYTDALVQLMNTFQSKGEPEACIQTLQEIFNESAILQTQCLRDYNSVLGYALSRTENMEEAETVIANTLYNKQ